jgi:hypothetical protein
MEHFLRWLDELDDLLRVLRVQARPMLVTLLLLAAFLAVAGAIIAFGAPSLLAAP